MTRRFHLAIWCSIGVVGGVGFGWPAVSVAQSPTAEQSLEANRPDTQPGSQSEASVPTELKPTIRDTPSAAPLTAAELSRRQAIQERARLVTRRIVTEILDIQIRQLADNNLQNDDVYREIVSMRANIDGLIDGRMRSVVETLARAAEAPPEQAGELMRTVRADVRGVVETIRAERLRLRRRLQMARLSTEVQQVIARQQQVYDTTIASVSAAGSARERAALALRDDQRGVTTLFLGLLELLAEMRTWGGDDGATAADGLRLLRTGRVGEELDAADQALASSSLASAARSEAAVLRGLRALLERVESRQNDLASDRAAILERLRAMIDRQQTLQDQARTTDLASAEAESLIENQSALHRDLAPLVAALAPMPDALEPIETARSSAYAALSDLFEGNRDAALAQQTSVIGNLQTVADRLEASLGGDTSDRSAAELADQVRALTELKETLETVADQQAEVAATAPSDATMAATTQAEVAERVAPLAQQPRLPPAVSARLAEATEATASAAETLREASEPISRDSATTAAVERATEAVERSLAEVESALADAARKQLAVEVGELARAAEALERAAATERELAGQAVKAQAGLAPITQDELAKWTENQEAVERTVAKVREGIDALSPDAAETLAQALPPIQSARDALAATQAALKQDAGEQTPTRQDRPDGDKQDQLPGDETRTSGDPASSEDGSSGPPEPTAESGTVAERSPPSPEAKQAFAQAGQEADAASRSLTSAAATLRSAAGEAAEKLKSLADAQLAQVDQAQQGVETLRDQAGGDTPASRSAEDASPPSSANALKQALSQVAEAKRQQQIASGRSEAAKWERLRQEVAALAQSQDQAERDVAALRAGRADTPLAAIERENQVADTARELASRLPSDLASDLDQASDAAMQAARSLLGNNRADADQAQTRAAEAIARTADALAQRASEAAQSANGTPDPTAQRRVADLAERAMRQVTPDSPVSSALEGAAEAARNAAAAMASPPRPSSPDSASGQSSSGDSSANSPSDVGPSTENGSDAVAESQATVSERLAQAERAIRDQLATHAERVAQNASEVGQAAEQLARSSARIAPDAAAALHRAAQSARDLPPMASPVAPSPDTSSPRPVSGPRSGQASDPAAVADRQQTELDRAAASLASRAREIAADRQIAATMADLTRDQQQARNAIDTAAQRLMQALESLGASADQAPASSEPTLSEPTSSETPSMEAPSTDAPSSGATPSEAGSASRQPGTGSSASQSRSPTEGTPVGEAPGQSAQTPAMDAMIAAARDLGEATRQFAQSQRATGEGAAAISRQEQVANRPLREGLDAASELRNALADAGARPTEQDGAATDGSMAPGEGATSPGEADAAPPPTGDGGSASSPSGTGDSGQTQSGEPGAVPEGGRGGEPGAPSTGASEASGRRPAPGATPPTRRPDSAGMPSRELGTGLVPASPEATAEQIAGSAITQAAESLLRQLGELAPDESLASGTGPSPPPRGDAMPPQSPSAGSAPASDVGQAEGSADPAAGEEGGSESAASGMTADGARGGPTDGNPTSPQDQDRDPTLADPTRQDSRTGSSEADAAVGDRAVEGEPWFAKLPATLRDAIRSNSRRTPPRAYQEKMRNYFESP